MEDLECGVMPTPDGLQTLLDSDCDMYIFSGIDSVSEVRLKLNLEWEQVPLSNDRLSEDVEGQEDMTNRLTLVHIAGFFTDGSDFIYYIKGGSNMSKFLLGTFSGKPYDKPCFATPLVVFESGELFNSLGLDTFSLEKVSKTESKGIRWKYLYESGVKAWEKLSFDGDKYEKIRKRNDEIDDRFLMASDSESPVVEVAASEGETPETEGTTPGLKDAEDQSDDSNKDVDDDGRVDDSDVAMGITGDDSTEDVEEYESAEESDVGLPEMDTPGNEDEEMI